MVISSTPKESVRVTLDGKEIMLTGGSRRAMSTGTRTDRYRYVDGAFRLIDRRFFHSDTDLFFHTETEESAYGRFWDGLVAEDVVRADAEADYRASLDPARKAHPGSVWRYNSQPLKLNAAEIEAFGDALRTLARFRLGALLMQTGRKQEAGDVLNPNSSPYSGLLDAMRTAPSREVGCQAADVWAAANPDFLPARNRGVANSPWKPELLCPHMPIGDSLNS